METSFSPTFEYPYISFKSYYVVWKHICSIMFGFFVISLNRTMQYGNTYDWIAEDIASIGLNRTMQYGNKNKQTKINM